MKSQLYLKFRKAFDCNHFIEPKQNISAVTSLQILGHVSALFQGYNVFLIL